MMDGSHFDDLTRSMTDSRRALFGGMVMAAAGWLGVAGARVKKKHRRKGKKRKPKAKPNEYGCLEVGDPCTSEEQCCSGICEGSTPKKGKKDSGRCVGHDAGICNVGFDFCSTGSIHFCRSGDNTSACTLTTGNAPFCGSFRGTVDNCTECSRDTDCLDEFGPGAACVVLGGVCGSYCPGTGRALCMPPATGPEM